MVLRGGEPCELLRTFLPVVLIGGYAFKIQAYRVAVVILGTRPAALPQANVVELVEQFA